MSGLQGLVALGARAAAAGASAFGLGNLTGYSPADELIVARSPGFRTAVGMLHSKTSVSKTPTLDGVVVRPVQISPRLDGLEIVASGALEDRIILYFHGGAHCICSASTHAELVGRLSHVTKARVFSINYRLAPQDPFPAGLDDALTALHWLRETYPGIPVAVAGDSAGGNLAFALLVKLAQRGESQPVACIGLSPWLLLDVKRIPSVRAPRKDVNQQWGGDVISAIAKISQSGDYFGAMGECMAGKMHDVVAAQYFQDHPASDPLVSPMLSSEEVARHFPPILLHADRNEALSEDSKHMAALCRRAGVPVELELYDGTAHVFQMLPRRFPESSRDSFAKINAFLDKLWSAPQAVPAPPVTEAGFREGGIVVVCGLQSQPELNGKRGTLASFNQESLRWNVEIEGAGTKALKHSNLVLVQHFATTEEADLHEGTTVVVHGLQAKPELNGKLGILASFNQESLRWNVEVEGVGTKALKDSNLARVQDSIKTVEASSPQPQV